MVKNRVWRTSVGSASVLLQGRFELNSVRHPTEVLLLLSEEAMRIQEDRALRMVKAA